MFCPFLNASQTVGIARREMNEVLVGTLVSTAPGGGSSWQHALSKTVGLKLDVRLVVG